MRSPSSDDLARRLREIDPMADVVVEVPSLSEVLRVEVLRAERGAVYPATASEIHSVHEGVPSRRPRRRMLAVATALVVAAGVAGVVVAAWPSSGGVGSQPADGASVADGPPSAGPGLDAWSAFPIAQNPRPVVLLEPDVSDPARGFVDGDDKAAYLDKQIRVGVALPTAPTQAGAYDLRTAGDAVAELTGGVEPTSPTALTISGVTLSAHTFRTDRGPVSLPAWAVRFHGVSDPAYVLALADHDRYDVKGYDIFVVSSRDVAVRGDQVTFAFTPSHTSTGPCDSAYTETADLQQTAELVILTVTVHVEASDAHPEAISCPAVGVGTVDPPLVPGTAGTKTLTLDAPLGHRPVVDDQGAPWSATVVGS